MPVLGVMHGREGERLRLVAALRAGRSAVLTGPVGIGKSRLAQAVTADLASQGHRVRQVLATAATADIPLGALAPLLPAALPGTLSTGDGGALAAAREAILGLGSAGMALIVDDAHLLDGVSAALIQQLVSSGRVATMLLTRALTALPAPAAALARGDDVTKVSVTPLSAAESAALAEAELNGQLDGTAAAQLHRLSGGVPLLLRELIGLTLGSGALSQRRGVWQLTGGIPADLGLGHLVSLRLEELGQRQREAAEAVALAEPLALTTLERLAGHAAIEDLETRGLLLVTGGDGAETTRLAHPLYGELLRAALPGTRRRRLARTLTAAFEQTGDGDPVQCELLRLTAGLPGHPGRLLAAGLLARQHDHPLATRLLRAAVRAGGGVPAALALAELLATTDADEALAVLAPLTEATLSPADWTGIQAVRALAMSLGSAGPGDVLAELGDVTGKPPPLRLAAALAHLFAGHATQAAALCRELIAESGGPGAAAAAPASAGLLITLCLTAALATTGELDAAAAVAEPVLTLPPAADEGAGPYFWGTAAGLLLALERRGDLDRVTALGTDLLDLATRRADIVGRSRMLQSLGRADLLRGRPAAAARALRETISLLRGIDESFLAWNYGLLAAAQAAAGQPEAAAASLAEMDAIPRQLPMFVPEQELCRALVHTARGELGAARAAARAAAELAVSLGHAPVALAGWHWLARCGEPRAALPGARAAADRVDGPLAALLRDHVAALATRSQDLLAATAERLADLGLRPLAAEALSEAAAVARASGDQQAAAAWAERLHRVLAACEPCCLPASSLRDIAESALTRREREIALLAANGTSDREIAARLGISPRTVQTHLARAYAKTGVAGRDQLAGLFGLGQLNLGQQNGDMDADRHRAD